jgi:hypothetical protein
LEIHKPKPVHNWRELTSEVGVIVVGIIIALSAEQFLERLEWHHKISRAEEPCAGKLRTLIGCEP